MRRILGLILLLVSSAAHSADLDLSPYKGKVVYVDLWAAWCPPCRASFPWMEALHTDLRDQGLVVLAVNTADDPADAARFLAKAQPSFTIITDPEGDIAESLGATGMPYSVIFDRNGERVSSHVGFQLKNAPALRRSIKALLSSTEQTN